MKEFQVNKYITLKLVDNKTIIYVNDEWFDQCKFILTRKKIFDLDNILKIDSVDELADLSIDEMAENLDHRLEGESPELIEIPTHVRFWVHCSNLQVWTENNYDTRLLHSNLSFPLLKKLTEVGDAQARRVFKEEIAKRIESGYPSVIKYLINEGYIKFLDKEEFSSLDLKKITNFKPELSIPIIKQMVLVGLSNLNNLFKKKIIEGFKEGTESLRNYLYSNEYLSYLSKNENLDIIPLKGERNILIEIEHKLKNQFVYHAYGLDTTDSLKFDIEGKNISGLGFYKINFNEKVSLKEVLENLLELRSLKALYLNNNQLKKLPDSIGKLQSLQVLYLNNNQLKNIPDSIGNLKNLSFLDASNNKITTIPKSFVNLKKLRYLGLGNNNLKELSNAIEGLTSLKTLILENNKLTSLPESIGNIKTLIYLKISGNEIASFPASLAESESLVII